MRNADRFRAKYGPRALVVGGSDGIGAAFAVALARHGLDLDLVARREDVLESFADRLRVQYGVAVSTLSADVSTTAGTDVVLRRAESQDLGLIICNAAFSPIGSFLELPLLVHERLLAQNCRAVAVLAHGLGKKFVQRGSGGIVLLTSMAGFQGSAQVAHYAASKAYVRVLGEGLWEELRRKGVDVVACCAGRVRTPTFERTQPRPLGWLAPPLLEPDDVVLETLAALGRQPVVIPGLLNRIAVWITERLLPRKFAVVCVSAATRAMYPSSGPPGSRPPAARASRDG